MKPIAHIPTKEEKEQAALAQRAQIYLQKQESYALNAALKMLDKVEGIPTDEQIDTIVKKSAKFADTMLRELFKVDEDKKDSGNKED
jgi:predicted naringenin-chalcone synthase